MMRCPRRAKNKIYKKRQLPCTNIVAFSVGKSMCNSQAKSDRVDCTCPILVVRNLVHENRQSCVVVEYGPIQSVGIKIVLGWKTLPLPPRTIVPMETLHRCLYMMQRILVD